MTATLRHQENEGNNLFSFPTTIVVGLDQSKSRIETCTQQEKVSKRHCMSFEDFEHFALGFIITKHKWRNKTIHQIMNGRHQYIL